MGGAVTPPSPSIHSITASVGKYCVQKSILIKYKIQRAFLCISRMGGGGIEENARLYVSLVIGQGNFYSRTSLATLLQREAHWRIFVLLSLTYFVMGLKFAIFCENP